MAHAQHTHEPQRKHKLIGNVGGVLAMLPVLTELPVLAVPEQGPLGGEGVRFFSWGIIEHFIKALFSNLENLCFYKIPSLFHNSVHLKLLW